MNHFVSFQDSLDPRVHQDQTVVLDCVVIRENEDHRANLAWTGDLVSCLFLYFPTSHMSCKISRNDCNFGAKDKQKINSGFSLMHPFQGAYKSLNSFLQLQAQMFPSVVENFRKIQQKKQPAQHLKKY